jgi:Protein of unknown function (DUF2914)/Tetratricopeptide repeat
MADVLDPASLVEAAQKAAADGDYLAAERLLREAAVIQGATLGSNHPDLAITLNNLAFVCERTGNFAEAERGYRRAHAIAVASLGPGHSFIATSLKNLVEFCAAHEIPIWTPPAVRADEEPPYDADVEESEVEIAPEVRDEPTAVTSRFTPRTIAVAALGVAAIVLVFFARQGQGTTDPPRPVTQVQEKSTPDPPPPVSMATPVPRPESRPPATRERRPATTNAPVTVLNAQLCSALEKRGSPDWQCAPAGGDLQPGTYSFYTRLLTNANTTVEHRWYHGNRVHQVMRLRVTASPGGGYRTFSSNTVSPERAGDWRVELRAADGSLLQEEHFIVR